MLSVVIPALNEGDPLRELVDWLVEEEGVGEVIIVEAGDSLPGGVSALAARDDRVRYLHLEQPGRAMQMNYGATQCRLPWICFIHADSRPPRGFAQLIGRTLDHNQWGRFNVRIDHPAWRFRLIETMINLRSRLTGLATGDQGLYFRREFFTDRGGFLEIPLMEDIEISNRLRKEHAPAVIAKPMQTSARRWLQHGTLRTILLMWKIRFLYWRGTNPSILAKMYRHAR